MIRGGIANSALLLGAALALLMGAAACGNPTGPVDVTALEERYPGVAEQRGHRLTEIGPHFWIAGSELLEFICLWPADRAIEIEVTAGASEAERRLVEHAVAALGPVIGRDFELLEERGPSGEPPSQRGVATGIQLEFIEGPDPEDPARMSLTAGDAIADCRVELAAGAAFEGSTLPAELESASVRIRRARADALGRVRPLDEVELLGALLHELGHALGFSTHTLGGDTVMRLAPMEVRRMARSVAAGRPLQDPTLSALYQVASGTVSARAEAPAQAVTTLRVFALLAEEGAWSPPRTRSGVHTAELWWPREDAARVSLVANRPRPGEAWPPTFRLQANPAGRAVLRAN